MAAALLGLTTLYALALFPGLEYHSGYYGFVYKIIHPESFPGDLYFTPRQAEQTERYVEPIRTLIAAFSIHPAFFSTYTILVKLAGERWLDDRFNLAVYWLVVLLTMWGVERIGALLGLGPVQRLALVAILAVAHPFKDNIGELVSTKNYSPTTFAYPLTTWLAYFVLRGGPPGAVVTLALLAVATSLKNSWFPALVAVLILLRERFGLPWRRIAGLVVLALALVFAGYVVMHGANAENAFVFDEAHKGTENSEADPFMESGTGNATYLLLLAAASLVPIGSSEIRRRVGTLCLLAALVFLCGGLYYTFVPDPLKVPLFMALAVNRSTLWPQLLTYIFLAAYAMKRIEAGSARSAGLGVALLVFLYGLPWFRYLTYEFVPLYTRKVLVVIVLQALLLVALFLIRRSRHGELAGRRWPPVATGLARLFAQPLHVSVRPWFLTVHSRRAEKRADRGRREEEPRGVCGDTLRGSDDRERRDAKLIGTALVVPFILVTVAYLGRATLTRIPSLTFLAKHGVMGGSAGARWVGLNAFFRHQLGPGTVLALVEPNPSRSAPDDLGVDSSLRIRTGRSMPFGSSAMIYFDAEKRRENAKREGVAASLPRHWKECDVPAILRDLEIAGNPEYLVVPAGRVCQTERLSFTLEREINGFAILKR